MKPPTRLRDALIVVQRPTMCAGQSYAVSEMAGTSTGSVGSRLRSRDPKIRNEQWIGVFADSAGVFGARFGRRAERFSDAICRKKRHDPNAFHPPCSIDDVRVSVTLLRETGIERRHEFEAPVPETPMSFQFERGYMCDTAIILLTVEYPWRHDWPQTMRTLDTLAFRTSDLAFIDIPPGPLTDIALLDATSQKQPMKCSRQSSSNAVPTRLRQHPDSL